MYDEQNISSEGTYHNEQELRVLERISLCLYAWYQFYFH